MSGPYRGGDVVLQERIETLRAHRASLLERRRDLDVEVRDVDREIAVTLATLRWGETPIGSYFAIPVVAGLLAAGCLAAMWIHDGMSRHANLGAARVGAETVFRAATARSFCDAPVACMTLAEVVREKRLAPAKMDDPWGRPYRIACDDELFPLHVWSAGADGVHGTADDIGDHFTRQDLARVAALD